MPAKQAQLMILQQLLVKPDSSQRELADKLGISLGTANACLQALMEAGCIILHNFHNQHNKFSHAYLLTPAGLRQKMQLAKDLLLHKLQTFETLRDEIAVLQTEVYAGMQAEIEALRKQIEATAVGAGSTI